MVDLNGLKDKINSNWLVPSMPDGQYLSVPHIGRIEIKKAKWKYNKKSYEKRILGIVKKMNPNMENIFNCYGKDVETINGIRFTWPSMGNPRICKSGVPSNPCSSVSMGDYIWHVRKKGNDYFLVSVQIYEDDTVKISGLDENREYKFKEFLKVLKDSGEYSIPDTGKKFIIKSLGEFLIGENSKFIVFSSLVGELEDKREQIQGRKGKVEFCMDAFNAYSKSPSIQNFEDFKAKYESVPEHMKIYCGDYSLRDIPIRKVLYGKEEITNI